MFAHNSPWIPSFFEEITKFPFPSFAVKVFEHLKRNISDSGITTVNPNISLEVEVDTSDYAISSASIHSWLFLRKTCLCDWQEFIFKLLIQSLPHKNGSTWISNNFLEIIPNKILSCFISQARNFKCTTDAVCTELQSSAVSSQHVHSHENKKRNI